MRQLLGDLAEEERKHERIAEELEKAAEPHEEEEAAARRRLFVLQVVQPGLAGLMDGSVSTLAPIFAAAFATRYSPTGPGKRSWSAWRPASGRESAWASPRRCPTTAV